MTTEFSMKIRELDVAGTNTYEIKTGKIPVIITSAHGIGQKKRSGWKFAERLTRGIAKYVAKKTDCYYLIKNQDTGADPNKDNDDEFKTILLDLIKKHHIKLAIDLHGAKKDWDFDVEIGTLGGESMDQKVLDKLIRSLEKNKIKKIAIDNPFKGGDITKTVREKAGINCVQLEVNQNYRSLIKTKEMKRLCRALIMFVGS